MAVRGMHAFFSSPYNSLLVPLYSSPGRIFGVSDTITTVSQNLEGMTLF
jgi:hypothetical protein